MDNNQPRVPAAQTGGGVSAAPRTSSREPYTAPLGGGSSGGIQYRDAAPGTAALKTYNENNPSSIMNQTNNMRNERLGVTPQAPNVGTNSAMQTSGGVGGIQYNNAIPGTAALKTYNENNPSSIMNQANSMMNDRLGTTPQPQQGSTFANDLAGGQQQQQDFSKYQNALDPDAMFNQARTQMTSLGDEQPQYDFTKQSDYFDWLQKVNPKSYEDMTSKFEPTRFLDLVEQQRSTLEKENRKALGTAIGQQLLWAGTPMEGNT